MDALTSLTATAATVVPTVAAHHVVSTTNTTPLAPLQSSSSPRSAMQRSAATDHNDAHNHSGVLGVPPPALPRHCRPTSSSSARNLGNGSMSSLKESYSAGGASTSGGEGGCDSSSSLTPRGFAAVCVLPCGLRGSPPRTVFRTTAASLLQLSKDRHSSSAPSSRGRQRWSAPASVGSTVHSWFAGAHPAEIGNNLRVLDSFPTLPSTSSAGGSGRGGSGGYENKHLRFSPTPQQQQHQQQKKPHPEQPLQHEAYSDIAAITPTSSSSYGAAASGAVNTNASSRVAQGESGPHGQVHVYTSGLPHSLRCKHRQHQQSRRGRLGSPFPAAVAGPLPPSAAAGTGASGQGLPPRSPRLSPRQTTHTTRSAQCDPTTAASSARSRRTEDLLPPTPKLKTRSLRRHEQHHHRHDDDDDAAAATPSPPPSLSLGTSTQISGHDDALATTHGNLIRLMYQALQETTATAVAAASAASALGSGSGGHVPDLPNAELFEALRRSMDDYQLLQQR